MTQELARDLIPRYRAILTDIGCIKILARCVLNPSSVKDLAMELDIPITMCYRRVNDMVAVGLLRHVGDRGKGHRKEKIYESILRSYTIRYVKGSIVMDMEIEGVDGTVRAVLGK